MVARYTRALSGELAIDEFRRVWMSSLRPLRLRPSGSDFAAITATVADEINWGDGIESKGRSPR